ncbi:NAD(P)H-binding protein [Nonomuraea turcica]|uniref:NAD(P)H-binding protein n=1 Tax=Nonomuraea sp. G32 TaxID=3067274 RepID=UPI0035302616
MKLLVLGGTHHVGRALVETALERGDEVSTLNRGLSRPPAPGVRALVADRTDTAALAAALAGQEWDAVVDTWAWAPRVVRDSARLLAGRTGHYGYVSSRGVHRWPSTSGARTRAPRSSTATPTATTVPTTPPPSAAASWPPSRPTVSGRCWPGPG